MAGKILKRLWLLNLALIAGCQITPQNGTTGPAVAAPTQSTAPILVHSATGDKGQSLVVRQTGENVLGQKGGVAMPAIFILPSQRLVSVSSVNLIPGQDNQLRIKWSDLSLTPLTIDKLQLVEYDMPTMPAMGGPFTAALTKISATETEALLEVAHGGYWELKLVFAGAKPSTTETMKIGVDVPKGRGR